MCIKRLNKEYRLDICDKISLKYGSVNRLNPQVVYVSGKCWLCPRTEMDYQSVLSLIKDKLKKMIKNRLFEDDIFENKLIFDFDVNFEKMNVGEKKFLSFDFFLRQRDENIKMLKDLDTKLKNKLSPVIDFLITELQENNFLVSKTKKS